MTRKSLTSQKLFLSESLNQYITFAMIPSLSDKDLNQIFCDAAETRASLKEYLSLVKDTEMDVYEKAKYNKARKKIIITDEFYNQIRREQEKRFQQSQELSKDDIAELVTNRKYLYDYEMTRETLEVFCEMLKETYDESVISSIHKQAMEKAASNLIKAN